MLKHLKTSYALVEDLLAGRIDQIPRMNNKSEVRAMYTKWRDLCFVAGPFTMSWPTPRSLVIAKENKRRQDKSNDPNENNDAHDHLVKL